jgi:hypothetical protein
VTGTEKMVKLAAPELLPLVVPEIELLGGWSPAWFGNCQALKSRGLKLRARIRDLILIMVILSK